MTRANPDLAPSPDWRLYFVTDTILCGGPQQVPRVVEAAVRGGAGVVQVRDKDLPDQEFADLARACIEAVRRAHDATGKSAEVFVNDRLGVAESLGLHVHLGQSDGDLATARRRLGSGRLIGLSISDDAELARELADPHADVLGLSPIWATPTKTDTAAPLGLEGAARLNNAADVACVAIGGINRTNARQVIATGVAGICVVSAIAASSDPEAAARELLSYYQEDL